MNDVAQISNLDQLKKPVNALAIVPQNRKITALGRKAYNVMLNIAQAQGVEKEVYRAPLSEIVSGLDYGSNDMELIKKHLRSMASTIVEWQSPTTGEGSKWTVCTLIAHAEILKERNQNFLIWSYAPPLRQELLSPAVFSKLSIGMLSQMHTHAGIVLYEICTRYKNIGRTSRQHWRWWVPVLTGHPDTEKLAKVEYRFFKRDTIKPAIAEVCAITDIEIELVEYKDGKSISEIQFNVKVKNQVTLPLKSPLKPVDLSIVKKANDLNIAEEKLEELVAKHGETEVKLALSELEQRILKAFPGPIRDPHRYLKARLSGVQQVDANANREDSEKLGRDETLKKQVELKASWRDEWLRRKKALMIESIQALSEEVVRDLEASLITELVAKNAHPSLVKRLKSNGWDHPMVRHLMIDYYATGSHGEGWDKPSTEDLLDLASESI